MKAAWIHSIVCLPPLGSSHTYLQHSRLERDALQRSTKLQAEIIKARLFEAGCRFIDPLAKLSDFHCTTITSGMTPPRCEWLFSRFDFSLTLGSDFSAQQWRRWHFYRWSVAVSSANEEKKQQQYKYRTFIQTAAPLCHDDEIMPKCHFSAYTPSDEPMRAPPKYSFFAHQTKQKRKASERTEKKSTPTTNTRLHVSRWNAFNSFRLRKVWIECEKENDKRTRMSVQRIGYKVGKKISQHINAHTHTGAARRSERTKKASTHFLFSASK